MEKTVKDTIKLIMLQPVPHEEEFKVMEELYRTKWMDSPQLFGVMCFMYGAIQGKRDTREHRKRV